MMAGERSRGRKDDGGEREGRWREREEEKESDGGERKRSWKRVWWSLEGEGE